MITSPQTHFSIPNNLASLNTIPQKLCLSRYIQCNKLVSAVSHQQVSCLCLLDISAAFDTIDHNILPQRLPAVSGTALYYGSNLICPLDPSLLKPATPPTLLWCPLRLWPGPIL